MNNYIPEIGDVVKYFGKNYVVMNIKSNEDIGSCSYDRKYFICDELYIRECQSLQSFDDLQFIGRWIDCYGSSSPSDLFVKVEDIVPYEIKIVNAYKIRRKKLQTIMFYE